MTTKAKLIGAQVMSARTIQLRLSDGTSRTIDVTQLLSGPVFAEIAENDDAIAKLFFNDELSTICWPNGADIAPETLLSLPSVSLS